MLLGEWGLLHLKRNKAGVGESWQRLARTLVRLDAVGAGVWLPRVLPSFCDRCVSAGSGVLQGECFPDPAF